MTRMIAFCGLVCSECPTFLATQSDDDVAREKTAAFIAENYGLFFKPEQINCDGCKADSERLIEFCRTCEVRKCGLSRKVDVCIDCPDQPCEVLQAFHKFSPAAKASYEALARTVSTAS